MEGKGDDRVWREAEGAEASECEGRASVEAERSGGQRWWCWREGRQFGIRLDPSFYAP